MKEIEIEREWGLPPVVVPITERMYGVQVKFEDTDRTYSYMSVIDGISVGDVVVVQAGSFYGAATVVGITPNVEARARKFVVAKVETSIVEQFKAMEKEWRQRGEQRAKIEAELRRRMNQIDLYERYKVLAEIDPVAKELLEQLKTL